MFVKKKSTFCQYHYQMNFWKNVDEELTYLGKTRKELSIQANFDPSYIPKGILRGSVPSADLAVRISHALNVPLEQLLEMNPTPSPAEEFSAQTAAERRLFSKYRTVIAQLESLSDKERNAVLLLVGKLSEHNKTSYPPPIC